MSVPCSDGRPAGMMLTAKHFDEVSIYRPASPLADATAVSGLVSATTAGSDAS
jgi:Asp-tRNA(Asn)/Glu-tRNA(Gln) amidotransferase A subunit family amidase